MNKCKVKLM